MGVIIGRGDNKAVTELSFAHVTTKTWTYSRVLAFSEKKNLLKKLSPTPPKSLFKNTMGNPFFDFLRYGLKS